MDSKAIAKARLEKIKEDLKQKIAKQKELKRIYSLKVSKALDTIRNLFDNSTFQQSIINTGQFNLVNIGIDIKNDSSFYESVVKIVKDKSDKYMEYYYSNLIIYGTSNLNQN